MTKKKNKYYDVRFEIDQMPGCCGIGVVCNFQEAGEYRPFNIYGYPSPRATSPSFKTREAQAKQLYERILNETWGHEVADRGDGEYSTLVITLVSKYALKARLSPQLPALAAILEKEGWDKKVFVNPNHGNEVTLWTKHFEERKTLSENNEWFEDERDDFDDE